MGFPKARPWLIPAPAVRFRANIEFQVSGDESADLVLRIKARHGAKKAVIAVAASILGAARASAACT
jgi:hypothetical protein